VCAKLHNLLIQAGDDFDEEPMDIPDHEEELYGGPIEPNALRAREALIGRF